MYELECRFTKFGEITQGKGHYGVQGYSRSPILVPIESSYATLLLVINSNLPPILHRFQVMVHFFAGERGVPHFNALARVHSLPISP